MQQAEQETWIPLNPRGGIKPPSTGEIQTGKIDVKRGTPAPEPQPSPLWKAGLIGALQPFSARDASGNWQMPPAVHAIGQMLPHTEMSQGDIGSRKISGPSLVGLPDKAKELWQNSPLGWMSAPDRQTFAEGLGQTLMAIFMAKLGSATEAFKGSPKQAEFTDPKQLSAGQPPLQLTGETEPTATIEAPPDRAAGPAPPQKALPRATFEAPASRLRMEVERGPGGRFKKVYMLDDKPVEATTIQPKPPPKKGK